MKKLISLAAAFILLAAVANAQSNTGNAATDPSTPTAVVPATTVSGSTVTETKAANSKAETKTHAACCKKDKKSCCKDKTAQHDKKGCAAEANAGKSCCSKKEKTEAKFETKE